MPRILGVDIPREKRTNIALTYIFGVGRKTSDRVLAEVKVDPAKRAKDLTEKEIAVILDDPLRLSRRARSVRDTGNGVR